MSLIVRTYLVTIPSIMLLFVGTMLHSRGKKRDDTTLAQRGAILFFAGVVLLAVGILLARYCVNQGRSCF